MITNKQTNNLIDFNYYLIIKLEKVLLLLIICASQSLLVNNYKIIYLVLLRYKALYELVDVYL